MFANNMRLLCHPASVTTVVDSLTVSCRPGAHQHLIIDFQLRGAVTQISIPEEPVTGPVDGLWEHTCFEAFIGIAGKTSYREFNFSPSGAWASYVFSAYRERDEQAKAKPVQRIACGRTASHLVMRAEFKLPDIPKDGRLEVGLAAVIEEKTGVRTYWALAHPEARPNFHRRDAFVLQLTSSDLTKMFKR